MKGGRIIVVVGLDGYLGQSIRCFGLRGAPLEDDAQRPDRSGDRKQPHDRPPVHFRAIIHVVPGHFKNDNGEADTSSQSVITLMIGGNEGVNQVNENQRSDENEGEGLIRLR